MKGCWSAGLVGLLLLCNLRWDASICGGTLNCCANILKYAVQFQLLYEEVKLWLCIPALKEGCNQTLLEYLVKTGSFVFSVAIFLSFCSKHYTSEHFAHLCCFIVLILFIYSSGAVGLLWKEPNLSRSKSTSLRFPTSSLFKKKLHSCTCGSEGKLKWNVDSSPGCSQSNSDLKPKNSYDGKHTFIAALIHILLHTPSRTHSPRLRWTDGTLKICTVFVFMWGFFPICLPERETKHSSMSLPCSDAPVTEIQQTHAAPSYHSPSLCNQLKLPVIDLCHRPITVAAQRHRNSCQSCLGCRGVMMSPSAGRFKNSIRGVLPSEGWRKTWATNRRWK